MRRFLPIVLPVVLLIAALGTAQTPPFKDSELVMPADFAAHMNGALILHVGFPVLYRAAHIPESQYAGPGSKPEGVEALAKAVAGQPHDRDIVLYCGCCPWDKCPNVKPAIEALRKMGFTHVRAMVIKENFKTDWSDKNYPVERRAEP
jgi:thiosulfate/3-mercaptopyruvate sulfurtransferase